MVFFRHPRNRPLKRCTTERRRRAMLKRSMLKLTKWRDRTAIYALRAHSNRCGSRMKPAILASHNVTVRRRRARQIQIVIAMKVTSESGREIEVTNADPPRIEAI